MNSKPDLIKLRAMGEELDSAYKRVIRAAAGGYPVASAIELLQATVQEFTTLAVTPKETGK